MGVNNTIVNCFQRAGFLDGESTKVYELDVEAEISNGESTEIYLDDWISLQNRMNFIRSFEDYMSAGDEVLSCEVFSVDVCEVKENKKWVKMMKKKFL